MLDVYRSLQAAIKAAKQGRNGAGDALEQIRAKAEDVFVAIEEERRKFKYVTRPEPPF